MYLQNHHTALQKRPFGTILSPPNVNIASVANLASHNLCQQRQLHRWLWRVSCQNPAHPSSPPACAHREYIHIYIYLGDLGHAGSTSKATVQCSIAQIKSGRHSDSANASSVTTASLAVSAPYAQHSRNYQKNGKNFPFASLQHNSAHSESEM